MGVVATHILNRTAGRSHTPEEQQCHSVTSLLQQQQ